MFEKNFNALKKRFPEVADQILSLKSPDDGIEIVRSRTGLPVASVLRNGRRLYLNSSYDPELDARRWVPANFEPESLDFCILGGAGFFYHVKAMLESGFFKKIIVYEPECKILKACLHEVDLTTVFQDEHFEIVSGTDYESIARQAVGNYGSSMVFSDLKIQIKSLPAYIELYSEEIQSFLDAVRELIKLYQLNLTTVEVFSKDWMRNTFKTLPNAISSPVVRHYFDQFKNMPAVVVSAGPSLEKNIHLLKEIRENVVIICAGSSIRAMNRNGILPHFLLALDYGEVNSQVYDDLDLNDVYLVFNCHFWHVSASKFKGKKILYKMPVEGIPELFIEQNRGKEIGVLLSGFSVSHTALNFAYQMGCNPIILIGQDLAYTGKKRYAEGQVAETIEFFEKENIKKKSFVTKDIYGEDILTDYELDGFRIIFEKMIKNNYQDKVQIINATEGGLHIQGTVDRRLGEVIREYCGTNQDITGRIGAIYEQGLQEIAHHPVDIQEFQRKIKTLMERGNKALLDLIERIQALRKQNLTSNDLQLEKLEPVLNRIRSDYDHALVDQEYHRLLSDFHSSGLSVLKALTDKFETIKTKEEYDQKLQAYLNIIINTKDALEFINGCMVDFLKENYPSSSSQGKVGEAADKQNIISLATQIKQGRDLNKISDRIENSLKKLDSPNRADYLYLYGLILWKRGETDRAMVFLEEAIKVDGSHAEAYFWLHRIYLKKQNYALALEALANCSRLNYRTKFCLKVKIKINYWNEDYITVNNLIQEYVKEYPDTKSLFLLKVDCLCRLRLNDQAEKLYQSLISKYHYSAKLLQAIQTLIADQTSTEYQECYEKNRDYFQKFYQISLPDYRQIRYRVCRLFKGEFVYDCQTGEFFRGFNHVQYIDLPITENDVTAIYNTDNTVVFERLLRIFNKIDFEEYRKKIEIAPVYIIEQDPEQWYFMVQLFEFEKLSIWKNIHYFLGFSPNYLEEVFLDEKIPLPNILYGTNPDEFKEFIARVKDKNDLIQKERLADLENYYTRLSPGHPAKILIRCGSSDSISMVYAKALHNYLQTHGVNCVIASEDAPYYKWTLDQDVKILYDFQPDLLINMLGIQEESEIYRRLQIPFISWFLSEKEISFDSNTVFKNQKFWITGNLEIESQLLNRGYSPESLMKIPLPAVIFQEEVSVEETGDIGIFGDLNDFEQLVNNFEIIFYGLMASRDQAVNRQVIISAIKAVYVSIYLNINNEGLKSLKFSDYEAKLEENFWRRGIKLDRDHIKMVAPLVKREFENMFFNLLQVKWIINDLKDYRIEVYGRGWDLDPVYKPYYQGDINSLNDLRGFQQAVLRNKVNLAMSMPLRNNSYLQPDLVNGLAGGGFFMVSDGLAKEYGARLYEPFGGMLETFGTRAELVEKIKFYLEHDEERILRRNQLQKHIQENLSFTRLFDSVFSQKASS